MARKALENYVPVAVRIAQFRKDHNGKGAIETEAVVDTDKECAHFKAVIKVEDRVLATGHSLSADLSDGKAFEKGETAAIGRALAHAGYEAEDPNYSTEMEEEEDSGSSKKGLGGEKKSSKKSKGLPGLGKSSKKKDEDEEEDESEEEENSEEETEEEDSSEESEEDEEEEKPKKSAAKKPSSKKSSNSKKSGSSKSKLNDVMSKYGLK